MSFRLQATLLTATVLICAVLVAAQTDPVARCYKFTWLGPEYNNGSIFRNATCSEATRLSKGVPCMHPLVASFDGSWPDVEYIWLHYTKQATCVLAKTDVCAQYTYYFDGHVENSTYMCTRGVDTNGMAITNGCYEQTNGSATTKVCFCRSIEGGVPCNTGVTAFVSYTTYLLLFTLLLSNRDVFMFN